MFLGHVGVGLALKKADPKLNVGWLVGASLLTDIVLWGLVIFGVERVIIPPDFADTHFLAFDFPYSHSLLATIVRSVLVFAVAYLIIRKHRRMIAAATLGSAVFLHWICDWLEHIPDLPVAGSDSAKLGLGLWKVMPVALGIEILLAALGLWIYFRTAAEVSSRRKWLVVALTAFIGALTVYGGLFSPAPPSPLAVAWSSLATNILVIGLYFSLDRPRTIR